MTDSFLKLLDDKRIRREEERMRINKRMGELNREADEDGIALRVYQNAMNHAAADQAIVPSAPRPNALRSGTQYEIEDGVPMPAQKPKRKDMILALLRDAYPNGLAAAQIRGKAFLKYREHINPNTLTVTLVRYSKGPDARVKSENRVWYYIPMEEEPNVPKPNGAGVHRSLFASNHESGDRP